MECPNFETSVEYEREERVEGVVVRGTTLMGWGLVIRVCSQERRGRVGVTLVDLS